MNTDKATVPTKYGDKRVERAKLFPGTSRWRRSQKEVAERRKKIP
jgi:hypothetical protein